MIRKRRRENNKKEKRVTPEYRLERNTEGQSRQNSPEGRDGLGGREGGVELGKVSREGFLRPRPFTHQIFGVEKVRSHRTDRWEKDTETGSRHRPNLNIFTGFNTNTKVMSVPRRKLVPPQR